MFVGVVSEGCEFVPLVEEAVDGRVPEFELRGTFFPAPVFAAFVIATCGGEAGFGVC